MLSLHQIFRTYFVTEQSNFNYQIISLLEQALINRAFKKDGNNLYGAVHHLCHYETVLTLSRYIDWIDRRIVDNSF